LYISAGLSSAPPKAKKSKLSHTAESAHDDSTATSNRHSSSTSGSSTKASNHNRIAVKEEAIEASEAAGTILYD
jgi:hypothetical protein